MQTRSKPGAFPLFSWMAIMDLSLTTEVQGSCGQSLRDGSIHSGLLRHPEMVENAAIFFRNCYTVQSQSVRRWRLSHNDLSVDCGISPRPLTAHILITNGFRCEDGPGRVCVYALKSVNSDHSGITDSVICINFGLLLQQTHIQAYYWHFSKWVAVQVEAVLYQYWQSLSS